jgi:hypothetical protein
MPILNRVSSSRVTHFKPPRAAALITDGDWKCVKWLPDLP